jgi:hypothetical protein
MNNFHYNQDPLYNTIANILLNEATSDDDGNITEATIADKVSKLAVGDKTNFGVVVSIDNDSITFKAKDLPKTKISFKQRKMGSSDYVLDKLTKLKEGVELDEDEHTYDSLDEAQKGPMDAKSQYVRKVMSEIIDFDADEYEQLLSSMVAHLSSQETLDDNADTLALIALLRKAHMTWKNRKGN